MFPDIPMSDNSKVKEKETKNEQIEEVQTETQKVTSDRPSRGGKAKNKSVDSEVGWIVPPSRKTAKAAQSSGAPSSVVGVNALSADAIDPG